MDSDALSQSTLLGFTSPSGDGDALDQLEAELRARLSGCRLVCEISPDNALRQRLVDAMTHLRNRGLTRDTNTLGRSYPAISATYLVVEGIFRYAGGNLWGNLEVEGLESRVLGPAFETAIRRLELETFERIAEEEHVLRFLMPILAHGGIPEYSLSDFFRVLLDELDRGAGDAGEVIARWRVSKSRFVNVDRPVERFLLHGGEISLDLLERCIDMVRECPPGVSVIDADRFGLPRYICEAYVGLEARAKRLAGTRLATAAPRPIIVIDPYDASGPMLLLPPGYGDYTGGSWSVVAGTSAARYRVVREDRLVPVGPAMEWTVELLYASGARARSFSFAGLGHQGVLLFDQEDGRLIADPGRLRSARVWLLSSCGNDGRPRADGAAEFLAPIEEAPPPTGAWDGYQLAAYDLSGVSRLTFGEQPASEVAGQNIRARSTWVRVQRSDIRLVGDVLSGVHSDPAGTPVYPRMPMLQIAGLAGVDEPTRSRWSARIECRGQRLFFDATGLEHRGENLLADLLPEGEVGEVHLYVRGVLGSDFRATFCVVPGLAIERPPGLLVPGRPPGSVVVRTACTPVKRLSIDEGAECIRLRVDGAGDSSIQLRILLPCLQWAAVVGADERGALGQSIVNIAANALRDGGSARLVVRTRIPHLWMVLRLCDGDRVLQEDTASAVGDEARWSFDLRRMSDTVRRAERPMLQLKLFADSQLIHVSDVRSDLEVTDLQSISRTVPGHTGITLTFKQGRPFKQRVARLWPLSQPWRKPTQVAIQDGVCEASFSDSDEMLPPGIYLAEIAVDDGWSTISRPDRGAAATIELRAGTVSEEAIWIQRANENDPFIVLASAYVLGHVRRPLADEEVSAIGPDALAALAVLHAYNQPGERMTASVEAVGRLLCPHSAALAHAMVSAAIDQRLGRGGALLVALDLIPRLAPMDVVAPVADDLEQLWELCSPLAAALDLPHLWRRSVADPSVRRRVETFLGLELTAAVRSPAIPRPRDLQPFLRVPVEQLKEIRRSSGLLPRRVLDIDNQATVQLEWLIADQREKFSARRWSAINRGLAASLPELPASVARDFLAARAPEVLIQALPEIAFPEVLYAAALHVVTGSMKAVKAASALQQLIPVCPGIVERSLVLAAVVSRATHL